MPVVRNDSSNSARAQAFRATSANLLEGLTDRSRRPYRQANRLPLQIEKLIVQLKREHPSWGAPKIRRLHEDLPLPAISTVHAILDRHELVDHSRRRRYKARGTHLSLPKRPNDLWCADY